MGYVNFTIRNSVMNNEQVWAKLRYDKCVMSFRFLKLMDVIDDARFTSGKKFKDIP